MENTYGFNDKKEKVKILPNVRKETVELEFSYRLYSLSNTLQTGTLTVPITFYKNGAMVLIDTFEISLQLTETTDPTITYDDNGKMCINFSHDFYETSEGKIGVDLTCTSTDKFKKYCPVGHDNERIYTQRYYSTVQINGNSVYTSSLRAYQWININKDEMIIHVNQKEAGMADMNSKPYMADNID